MLRNKQNENNEHVIDGVNTVFTSKSIENTQWAKWSNKNGGHGFSAEDANAQADRFRFAKVEVVGTNNQKDGADRIVHYRNRNTVAIQSKYYETANNQLEQHSKKKLGYIDIKVKLLRFPMSNTKMQFVRWQKKLKLIKYQV